MDPEVQDLFIRYVVPRDDPKYRIDPAFILYCRESWYLTIPSVIFYFCLFKASRARSLGRKHIPVIYQGAMVFSNTEIIALLCRQWYSYHRAFLTLDEELPNQIYMPVHIALYLGLLFTCLLGCVVIVHLFGLFRPRTILRTAQLDEEARHSESNEGYSTERYNQPLLNWTAHICLLCSWIVTCVSMQGKLPHAEYKNMQDANLFPPSRLELSLNALANSHFFFGIAGWILFSFGVIQFGKTMLLFRLDLTTRVKRGWRTIQAEIEVLRASERALEAPRPVRASTNSPPSPPSDENGVAGTHTEMESRWLSTPTLSNPRENVHDGDQSSWEMVEYRVDVESPQTARLRN